MVNKGLFFVLVLLLAFVVCKSQEVPSTSGDENLSEEDPSFQEIYTEDELLELIEAEDLNSEEQNKWTIPRRMMVASLHDYPRTGANGGHTP
ncbi:hypothetical protein vseg_020557 [Gypsophila vaccaria]